MTHLHDTSQTVWLVHIIGVRAVISVVEIVEFGVRWTMWTVDDYDDYDSYENDVNFDYGYGDHDERTVMEVRVMRWMMNVDGGCCVVSCHCC